MLIMPDIYKWMLICMIVIFDVTISAGNTDSVKVSYKSVDST